MGKLITSKMGMRKLVTAESETEKFYRRIRNEKIGNRPAEQNKNGKVGNRRIVVVRFGTADLNKGKLVTTQL